MTRFIPIFPLNVILYPGQPLNLHIFEPRYIELINDCNVQKRTFGIPSVSKEQLNEYGTEAEIVEIAKVYEDGKLDIKVKGKSVFRVLEVIKNVPDKLYSAAVIYNMPHLPFDTNSLNPTLQDLFATFHSCLGVSFDMRSKSENPLSFDIAPYCALSDEDQYRLLCASSEKARQWFIIQHLQKLIPELQQTELLKKKIAMNGHFRKEIPPKF